MSLYRVMERVPLSAYGKLHLTTRDGRVLSLNGRDFDEENSSEGPFMYAELCPLTSRVVSHLGPKAFAQRITDPKTTVCVPRIFFAETQVELDDGGHLASYLPYANPSHIEDCIREVEEPPQQTWQNCRPKSAVGSILSHNCNWFLSRRLHWNQVLRLSRCRDP